MKNIMLLASFFASAMVVFTQCNDNFMRNCNAGFFEKTNTNDTSELNLVFKCNNPITINSKCRYDHAFTFWRGAIIGDKSVPYIHLKGTIFKLGGAVYFELDSGSTFKYFDFDMVIGQSEPITFFKYLYDDYTRKSIKVNWKYNLILESKFIEASIHDTVYKFRFSKIGVQIEDTDIVFYVSQHYGLQGAYHASLSDDGMEEIFSSIGKIYNDEDKTHIRRYSQSNIL
jgi:hypothetical protein